MILCVCWVSSTPGEQDPVLFWRTPANGGVNVLFYFLSVHRIRCNYDDLVQDQAELGASKRHTPLTLISIADEYGVRLQPVLLSMDQLGSAPLPVIVRLDGNTPETGAFQLVIAVSKNTVVYINGPTATINELERAAFRRVWSGIALIPVATRGAEIRFGLCGLPLGIALVVAYRLFRRNTEQCGDTYAQDATFESP